MYRRCGEKRVEKRLFSFSFSLLCPVVAVARRRGIRRRTRRIVKLDQRAREPAL